MRARIEYDDVEFRRMWDDGIPTREMAQILGCSQDWVNKVARHNGLKREGPHLVQVDEDELRRLCEARLSWQQIGDKLGVSYELARARASKLGIRKEAVPRYGVSDEEFRRMWDDGIPTREMADALGLSVKSVHQRARRAGLTNRGRYDYTRPAKDPKPAKPEPVMRKCPHPNWPVMLDLKVFATAGKYAAIAALAEETRRPIAAIQQRWHVIGGRG